MPEADEHRVALRRETHDLNDNVAVLAAKIQTIDVEAARAIERAYIALFEAWTILCAPPQDDEDH